MTDAGGISLLDRCLSVGVEGNLRLYADLLGDDAMKHETSLPAMALRELCRRGEADPRVIPVLTAALVDAPNLAAFTHLAKALAAFGRKAQHAAPYVVERAREIAVTSDRRFWVLDSALHVLGYLGGPSAAAFVDELAGEDPPRVSRSHSVYQGELDDRARREHHARTLAKVRGLLAQPDAGEWRSKTTDLAVAEGGGKPSRMSPWMTR